MDSYKLLSEVSLDTSKKFPEDFYEHIKEIFDDEKPLISATADLNLHGQYEEQWVVVTDKKVHVISRLEDDIKTASYELKFIKDVIFNNFYGAGNIEVVTEDGAFEILRFTRRYRKQLNKFCEYLQKYLREEWIDIKEDKNRNPNENLQGENRCPNCGMPFPRGSVTCPKCSNKTETLKRLLTYLKPYKFKVIMMLLTTMIFALVNLIPPYLQKIMLDDVIIPGKLPLLKWIILAILLLHILSAVFQGVRSYQLSWLGQKIIYDLRSQVYSHLQSLGLSYYDRHMTGAIMNRVTGDTQSIQGFIVNGVQEVIVQIFTLIIIAVAMFVLDPRLALFVLIPTPFIYFGTIYFRKGIRKIYNRIWRRRSNLSSILGGAIPGIKVVKAFTQEQYEKDKFHEALANYFTEEIRAIRYRSIFFPIINIATTIGAVLIWGYGGYRVISVGDITIGTLTVFIGYVWRFYMPIQSLSHLSEQFEGATTAAERVFEVLDHEPEFKETIDTVESSSKKLDIDGNIEFENVSFHYRAEDEVLKNINLRINAGEMIGLVGASGSGKSTLVNLIPRFYEVSEGNIYIDGKDIMDYNLGALRSQIGVVLQEPYLFYGTIAENISYGRPSATMEEIVWAAKAANAHKFIMTFPDGYDTIIGERGVGLSGGEKQRISIARAILKNPKILILDEATSSVDTETEKLIQEAIDRLIKNRTTIAIAHRLSTLKNADRIIVLEDGNLVEEGTHDELMSIEDGAFKKLVEIQAEISRTQIV